MSIDWSQCPVVEIDPGLCGGTPVFKNTRLPVEAVLVNYDDGVDPDEIADIFQVALADVLAVLAYRSASTPEPPSP